MAVPTGTHSATVARGYINSADSQPIYYLGSYYNQSCYSFYKGRTRWIAISQYPGASFLVTENGAMFKSVDDGETWDLTGGLGPVVASGGGQPSPAYDVAFAAFDDVGVDPNAASKLTAMCVDDTISSFYKGFFADFDFPSETWGPVYGNVDYPTLAVDATSVPSSTPSGGFAYSVIENSAATPPYIISGASVVGSSPWLVIDAAGNAHVGDDPGGHFRVAEAAAGNVRIRDGSLMFAQGSPFSGHMEMLTRPVGSSTWTVETIPILDGLYDGEPPWMSSATDLFYVGVNRRSIYLTQKAGGVWGAPVLIWSRATDTNPDLAGATGGRIFQVIASCNPVLLGLDITFEFDGLASPPSDVMLTFHLPATGAGWSELVGGCTFADEPIVGCGDPPDGVVGTAYTHHFPVVGGTAPYVFTITAGTLPPGLVLTSGTGNVAGTPTVAGVYPVTVTVTDADDATGSVNCVINIIPAGSLGLGCAAPPDGVVGEEYHHTFPVSGGAPPYTFAIIDGILPPGLTLDSLTGEVSGTPTLPGDFEFTIQVSDDAGSTVGTCDITITVTNFPVPGIECDSPPAGVVGVVYSHTFPVTDIPEGSTFSYAITGGALPPGLTLNTATGEVTGTPTTTGHYTFTITLTVVEPDFLTDFAGSIIYTTGGDTIVVTHGIGGL